MVKVSRLMSVVAESDPNKWR